MPPPTIDDILSCFEDRIQSAHENINDSIELMFECCLDAGCIKDVNKLYQLKKYMQHHIKEVCAKYDIALKSTNLQGKRINQ